MALYIDKLLSDTRLLIAGLKEQEAYADILMSSSHALHQHIETIKQYQDDISMLNDISKHQPRSTLIMNIVKESRQVRDLQQEKNELQIALEEHQSALQLIMQKYRQHVAALLKADRMDACLLQHGLSTKDEVCRLMSKVDEMAGVMQHAIRVDNDNANRTHERLSCLELENRTLRELLEISSDSAPTEANLDDTVIHKVPAAGTSSRGQDT